MKPPPGRGLPPILSISKMYYLIIYIHLLQYTRPVLQIKGQFLYSKSSHPGIEQPLLPLIIFLIPTVNISKNYKDT